MSALRQGGPAFPGVTVNDSDVNLTDPWGTLLPPGTQSHYSGISLREFAAVHALQGLLANPKRYAYIAGLVEAGSITQEEASAKNARKAVLLADALLAELRSGS